MKKLLSRLVFMLAFAVGWFITQQTLTYAAGCSGSGCQGLNPDSMGCSTGAYTAGSYKILPDGKSKVETRANSTCDAKWARVTNLTTGYRYAGGSLRYGCSNYCYSQSVPTNGTIAPNLAVYTPMNAYIGTPTRSCGKVQTSNFSVPIAISSTDCTSSN
jgi:hypothetical protein